MGKNRKKKKSQLFHDVSAGKSRVQRKRAARPDRSNSFSKKKAKISAGSNHVDGPVAETEQELFHKHTNISIAAMGEFCNEDSEEAQQDNSIPSEEMINNESEMINLVENNEDEVINLIENNEDDVIDIADELDAEETEKKSVEEIENVSVVKFTRKTLSLDHCLQKYLICSLSDKRALVVMKKGDEFAVKGKVDVQVICGSVKIMDFKLLPEHGKQSVYSPFGYSYTTIKRTKNKNELNKRKEMLKKIKSFVKKNLKEQSVVIQDKIVASVKLNHAIIVLSECRSLACNYIGSIGKFQGLFEQQREAVVEGLNCNLLEDVTEGSSIKHLQVYNEVAEFIETQMNNDIKPVVVLCGGRNVGKSTMARHLLNSCLNRYSRAAFLECDPGQTEFTPAGTVSLHIISKPLLGPPLTHQWKGESQCFVGHLSPASDPDHYINCIKHVFNHWTTLDDSLPLIVNTMGWNKGMGLLLLVDTLRIVKADVVVQLNSDQPYRNMPDINTKYVSKQPGWTDMFQAVPEGYKHKLMTCHSTLKQSRKGLVAVDFRSLSFLSYFSSLFDTTDPVGMNFDLCSLAPYRVPWRDVAVHVCHSVVPNSQILYALNATLVALCHVDESMLYPRTSEADDLPRFLKQTPVCDCLGFGIVRAIDPIEKVFYILTPEGTSTLEQVNCLLKGAPDIPVEVLLQQKDEEVPYMDIRKSSPGNAGINKRRHLGRSGQD